MWATSSDDKDYQAKIGHNVIRLDHLIKFTEQNGPLFGLTEEESRGFYVDLRKDAGVAAELNVESIAKKVGQLHPDMDDQKKAYVTMQLMTVKIYYELSRVRDQVQGGHNEQAVERKAIRRDDWKSWGQKTIRWLIGTVIAISFYQGVVYLSDNHGLKMPVWAKPAVTKSLIPPV